jgi:copper chaperone CopZ
MNVFIEVENIKCGGCMNSIKSNLLKIEEVDNVEINIENNTILVTGLVQKSTIFSKLNELGYPEKGSYSVLKKAKSYVNCAIGKLNE